MTTTVVPGDVSSPSSAREGEGLTIVGGFAEELGDTRGATDSIEGGLDKAGHCWFLEMGESQAARDLEDVPPANAHLAPTRRRLNVDEISSRGPCTRRVLFTPSKASSAVPEGIEPLGKERYLPAKK